MAWDEFHQQNMSVFAALRTLRGIRILLGGIAAMAILSTFWLLSSTSTTSQALGFGHERKIIHHSPETDIILVTDVSEYFADIPIEKPFKMKYGELGRRNRLMAKWLSLAAASQDPTTQIYLDAVERICITQYIFLKNPQNTTSQHPVADLRATFTRGSAGIVIPTSDKTLRYAAHLIGSLRTVLASTLPIQVVYAGDSDLSATSRAHLASLSGTGPAIEFLNILTIFDDTTLQLQSGGWAIKAFAALGSHFETVILADADAVFLQPPEVLLQHPAVVQKGALLFHDRLLWQYAFADRHDWWHSQILHPSPEMNASLVWTQQYAEEADSGLVVLNKGRPDTFMGLLHICWQNSYEVREETTYKITHGDKESWWLGLELAGAQYEFSKHYGGIVGWEDVDDEGRNGVCSFVIAHVDAKNRLLWYNGSLLKNKGQSDMEFVYQVPEKWMIDAQWVKGARKQDHSCMVGGEVRSLTADEFGVLTRSIELAKTIDELVYPV